MKLQRIARSILSMTAVAWGIPFAQTEDSWVDELVHPKFGEADDCRDGKLDPFESVKFQSLQDDTYLAQVASDSAITAKVTRALLREPKLDSLGVSVETYKGKVLLSGSVKDEAQRRRALQAAAAVSGVTAVKDGLAVR